MAVTPDQVYGDAEWLRQQPGLRQRFSQILINSGIVPDAQTLQQYGLGDLYDANTSVAAVNNPYSTARMLQNKLQGTLTNNATRAGAHGAIFSGAAQNAQDQAGRDYQQAYSQAGANELGGLLGLKGDQENLYNTVYGRLLAQPVAADTTVYPGQGGNPQGMTEIDRPGAQANPWHIPTATGGTLQAFKPKKTSQVVGGRGRVT